MPQCQLSVARHGEKWGVSADGEVLAVARHKREAQKLAEGAARTLRASGFATRVVVALEGQSFGKGD